jgi:hypothetical protein
VRKQSRILPLGTIAVALALALAASAGGADRKPVPPTATLLTQEQIAEQHLEFSFGTVPDGPCGYVPNVVPPQISGSTDVGGTLTT